jgi:nucleotide-binding universal stress UspA family protein
MFEKVIVPLDGSKLAESVMPFAAMIGEAFDSEVTLVTAAETAMPNKCQFFKSYLLDIANDLKAVVKSGTNMVAKTEVLTGKPSDEILKLADASKADLIIIAGHGASGGNALVLGNTANKVLSGLTRPVLLVKTQRDAGNDQKATIKRILVPLDGSQMSESSLKTVQPMAARLGAEIVLFQAIEPVRYVPGFETMVPNVVLPSDEEVKQSAAKYLSGIEAPINKSGVKTSIAVVADAPAEAILDYAESGDIDLIAMTTHGFSGIKRWVFGSTTEKIIQAASKPVLVIPIRKT